MARSFSAIALLALGAIPEADRKDDLIIAMIQTDSCTMHVAVYKDSFINSDLKRKVVDTKAVYYRLKHVRFPMSFRSGQRVGKNQVLVSIRPENIEALGAMIHCADYKLEPKMFQQF